ncbi:MAG: ABC transporter substrate-binding protein [Candidatus Symbiodolus clandestinus]
MKYRVLLYTSLLALCLIVGLKIRQQSANSNLPLVAIANYGPHASLNATIEGIQQQLAKQGFIEQQTVRYAISDVGFDAALIPQMVKQLQQLKPTVMVLLTTPVAQFAKGAIRQIPLVYSAITDPVAAGLLTQADQPTANLTGCSERQDLQRLLTFAQQLLPHAKRLGLLYATAESNDQALRQMLRKAAEQQGLSLLALPINQAREVPLQLTQFQGKVDFIYVGSSGPIQPSLPTIAREAKKMGIPVFNVDASAVRQGEVLASFGVDYQKIGRKTGELITAILRGALPNQLPPCYPTAEDHQAVLSRRQAMAFHIPLPATQPQLMVVE